MSINNKFSLKQIAQITLASSLLFFTNLVAAKPENNNFINLSTSQNQIQSSSLLSLILVDVSWDGGGGDKNWNNANNWSTDTVPNNDDTIRISGPTSQVEKSTGSLSINNDGSLTVENGADFKIISGFLFVGGSGTGELNIKGGGVTSTWLTNIGRDPDSKGTVTVDGAGSNWTTTFLFVGVDGTGELNILGGGVASSGDARIGLNTGSNGSVTVDGAGSNWTTNIFDVGLYGTGELNIQDGGEVRSANIASIGVDNTGTVNITGSNSKWVHDGDIDIYEAGSVTLSNGGGLIVGNGTFDADTTKVNNGHTLNVRGILTTPFLVVGEDGTGVLNIQAGGEVRSADTASIGNTGTGNITGSNSKWAHDGNFTIHEAGSVTLSNGGGLIVGNATFAADTTKVNNDNFLAVDGSLTSPFVEINDNGILIGRGTITGEVSLNDGGLISPDSLTIVGDFNQNNSTYGAFIFPSGESSLISITGSANISGNSIVKVFTGGEPSVYTVGTQYTILTAKGGVNGTYARVNSTFPLLNLVLKQDDNNVYIVVQGNGASLASIGNTFNQRSTASGVSSLNPGNIVFDAVNSLPTSTDIRYALDSLSGEIYASTLSALQQESRYLREAVFNRMQSSLASNDFANINAPRAFQSLHSPLTHWVEAFGAWGELNGNINAAKLNSSTKGILFGADTPLNPLTRVGVLAGFSHSNFEVDARHSSADSDNYYLGAYAGTKVNHYGIRLGGAYTLQNLDTTRYVSFTGLNNTISSSNTFHTGQIFAELGRETQVSQLFLEPLVRAAYVNVDMEKFREKGGAASLLGDGSYSVPYTTLGLRLASNFAVKRAFNVTESALIGWNHAFNSTTPETTMTFLSGSLPFSVAGSPIARNSLLIDAGLNFQNNDKNATLRIAYIGQFSNQVQDNSVVGQLNWKFA